jgi:hypothetical protein
MTHNKFLLDILSILFDGSKHTCSKHETRDQCQMVNINLAHFTIVKSQHLYDFIQGSKLPRSPWMPSTETCVSRLAQICPEPTT